MNLVNPTDFPGVATNKNNNQIKSTVTTRTWVLPTELTRAWPVTGLVSR